jgi:histidinol-phosphate phosphatase family protein
VPHSPDAHDQPEPPLLVLFDRDGTLVDDVPYNGDPELVRLRPGAAEAVRQVRTAGVAIGIVTNQSGVGRGLITRTDVDRVNARVTALLGRFDTVQVCEHVEADRCRCRKPAPGMVLAAAAEVGVPLDRCVVIGDIGADVAAGTAAGARAILVPTGITLASEIERAPARAGTLVDAVDMALGGCAEP